MICRTFRFFGSRRVRPRVLTTCVLFLGLLPGSGSAQPVAAAIAQAPVSAMAGPSLGFPPGGAPVEIPFRLEAGKILVELSANGSEPLLFVLDSGSPTAVMLREEKLDGTSTQYVGQVQIGGAGASGSRRPARLARGVRFALGELEINDASMVVLPGESGNPFEQLAWDGIFGGQLFRNSVVEIDWVASRIRIHERGAFETPPSASVVPLEHDGGHVFITAGILSDGAAHSVRLVVDTGASHGLALHPGRVPAPSRRLSGVTVGRGLNGAISGDIGRIGELRLAGASLPGVVASFPADRPGRVTVGADGNLGTEVLRRFTTVFDVPRGRLVLVPNAAIGDPFTFSTSGLGVQPWVAEDGTVGIDDVYLDSPAARSGIEVGDRILSVDAVPVSDLGIDRLRDRLSEAPGTRVRLLIRRADTERHFELELREIL